MESALSRALALIARRDYTEAELKKKLSGYPEPEVEAAIKRLKDWGYLDDRRVAETYVRVRRGRWGPRKLRWHLKQRGISEADLEAVLPEEDREAALRLLEKRRARFLGKKERAVRFLLGRGYSFETALWAWDRLQEGGGEG